MNEMKAGNFDKDLMEIAIDELLPYLKQINQLLFVGNEVITFTCQVDDLKVTDRRTNVINELVGFDKKTSLFIQKMVSCWYQQRISASFGGIMLVF